MHAFSCIFTENLCAFSWNKFSEIGLSPSKVFLSKDDKSLIAVCKICESEFDQDSVNHMTLHHIGIMNYDVSCMETRVCRQYYSINNPLIFIVRGQIKSF